MLFFTCLICGGEDILLAKSLSKEERFRGFCTDCLDICESLGDGNSDSEDLKEYLDIDY